MSEADPGPALHGVLVTFRRPEQLATSLAAIAGQTVALRSLVVIDNAPCDETAAVVASAASPTTYVPTPENLGPAGGIAEGMTRVLAMAGDDDWIVLLDDDDPPPRSDVFAVLRDLAVGTSERDPSTAAVGLTGARFDRSKGRMVRVPDAELRGAVPVDYVGGNQFPTYRVGAVRAVGVFRRDLFFGFDDLEYGLRLGDHGYALYACGDTWLRARAELGRLGPRPGPRRTLEPPSWRRYYSLRNLIAILLSSGRWAAAVRVTLLVGLAKPVANLGPQPRLAFHHLGLAWRACRDAWGGRLGRRLEPA